MSSLYNMPQRDKKETLYWWLHVILVLQADEPTWGHTASSCSIHQTIQHYTYKNLQHSDHAAHSQDHKALKLHY